MSRELAPPSTPLDQLNAAIGFLDSGLATTEDVKNIIGLRATLKRIVAELDARTEDALVQWIQDHGEIEVGETRYYAGTRKVTKARNMRETVRTLLETVGLDRTIECLSANALKPGACKGAMEDWDKHFEVLVLPELREGVIRRRLLSTKSAEE